MPRPVARQQVPWQRARRGGVDRAAFEPAAQQEQIRCAAYPAGVEPDQLRRHRDDLERDVRRLCQACADPGAIEVTDVETVTTAHGHEREHGGRVALTPLGAAAMQRLTQR